MVVADGHGGMVVADGHGGMVVADGHGGMVVASFQGSDHGTITRIVNSDEGRQGSMVAHDVYEI